MTAISNARRDRRSGSIVADEQGAATDGKPARRWNMAALEERLDRCEAKAYRLAVQLIGNEPSARDVVQRALSAAWQDPENFANRREIETWVYRTTVKAALERCHCAKRRSPSGDDQCLLFTMTARNFWLRAGVAEDAEYLPGRRCSVASYRRLRKIVDALPEGLRAVFILGDLEEMPVDQLEEILGSPSENLKDRLHAARAAVQAAIADSQQMGCDPRCQGSPHPLCGTDATPLPT
jgi:RNA polymerase sigma-70 factor (ECF subfamily)